MEMEMEKITARNLAAGVTIAFTDNIWGGNYKRPEFVGSRIVTAKIIRESYGQKTGQHTFSMQVVSCVGDQPLSPGAKIRRMGRNVYPTVCIVENDLSDTEQHRLLEDKKNRALIKVALRQKREEIEKWN